MKTLAKNKPLVSVIMPIFNGSFYMEKAINSILAQTYQNFELLIVDDASTDNTWEILKKYKKNYPKKIKLFHLKKNSGAFTAANQAYAKAKGDYIAPMDCDDISSSTRLAKEVAYLTLHPKVILVGSFAKIINSNDQVTGYKRYEVTHKKIYRQFAQINPIVHPSCMIRKDCLKKRSFLYYTEYGVNSDYYTLFSLLPLGKFANIPEYLLSYRVHDKNSSLQNFKKRFYVISTIRLAAVKNFNYRFPLSSLPKVLLQHIIVALTPAAILLPLYLTIRGMKTPRPSFNRLNINIEFPAFLRLNRATKAFQSQA
ncbi:MAG: glycosyltransferase family 2 protein [Candidatus Daviesbacteria bacterium]